MSELQSVETWASTLLAKLQPAARRRLTVDIAKTLRADNSQRMASQTGPDGEVWEKRKPPPQSLRHQRGRIRQKAMQGMPMFRKLRAMKLLKARSTGDAAVVEFAAKAQRIARVHHSGESDVVNKFGTRYRYPARKLLGISEKDAQRLRDKLIDSLTM